MAHCAPVMLPMLVSCQLMVRDLAEEKGQGESAGKLSFCTGHRWLCVIWWGAVSVAPKNRKWPLGTTSAMILCHLLCHRAVKHQVAHIHVELGICSEGCPVLISLRDRINVIEIHAKKGPFMLFLFFLCQYFHCTVQLNSKVIDITMKRFIIACKWRQSTTTTWSSLSHFNIVPWNQEITRSQTNTFISVKR